VTDQVTSELAEHDRHLGDMQDGLRRVAKCVARGATAGQIFATVAYEMSGVLRVPSVTLARYEPNQAITVVASTDESRFATGTRLPLDGSGGFTAGVPIVIDGKVWGLATVCATEDEPVPLGAEERLRDFAKLAATAISSAESRSRLHRLTEERAALRRVARLVARGTTIAALARRVLEEVLELVGVPAAWLVRFEPDDSIAVLASLNDPVFPPGSRWPLDGPSLSATLRETGRPARIDDYGALRSTLAERTRASGYISVAGVPITVASSIWGAICVGTREGEPLSADTEAHLSRFTELIAGAISNAESAERLRRLADQQAALRRVATLVAEGATTAALGPAVVDEVVNVLDVPSGWLIRYSPDRTATVLSSTDDSAFPVGSAWPLEGSSVTAAVYETGRPARIDDFAALPGPIAGRTREASFRSAAAVPITVDASVWGSFCVATTELEPLPDDIVPRLSGFTELIATAISKALAHDELRLLADEQAALRRVATLVAETAPADEIFTAVARAVAHLFNLPWVGVMHYDSDESFTVVATWGEHPFPAGSRWPLDGPSTFELVLRTGRAARLTDYAGLPGTVAAAARRAGIVGGIGAPIVVDGATWGLIAAPSTEDRPIPEGAEIRLSRFTELVATAISNLKAHDDLRRLADEQAALRRVATLVAEGVTAEELFSAVAAEVGRVIDVSAALVDRYEPNGTAVTLAAWYEPDWTAFGDVNDYSDFEGTVDELARAAGVGSGCASPIVVDGELWGAIRAFSRHGVPLPPGTEVRLDRFTEPVAIAVSNAAARDELIASRVRIVEAGDGVRRRIERNLHDGTQQRLVALGLEIQHIRGALPDDQPAVDGGLERMQDDLELVLEDVRELSRSLHPPLLSRGGLRPSLRALARASAIPVELEIELDERPPASLEAAVYYIVAEALANAIEHSRATTIAIAISREQAGDKRRRQAATLHATVFDDGVGGAEPSRGSGLAGLIDRVDALEGRLTLDSPPGRGTRISIQLPLGDR
jgi:signal transduction histidine kinase